MWDPRVLEDIDAGRNPIGVTAYFGRLYDANYRDAVENDRPGKVIFFEGARITLEAHIAEYPAEHHTELRRVLAIGDAWNPDRIIVLTSNTDTVEKHIRQRHRPHESAENMVRRFTLIGRRVPPPGAALSEHGGDQPRQHGVPRPPRFSRRSSRPPACRCFARSATKRWDVSTVAQ